MGSVIDPTLLATILPDGFRTTGATKKTGGRAAIKGDWRMVPPQNSGSEYCLTRAKEIRDTADRCRDPSIKEQLLYVAREFEALSAIAATWRPQAASAIERDFCAPEDTRR